MSHWKTEYLSRIKGGRSNPMNFFLQTIYNTDIGIYAWNMQVSQEDLSLVCEWINLIIHMHPQ